MSNLFSKNRIIVGPGFNRWLVPPASVAIHLCIGSVYAWSIFNPPLERVRGVVGRAADDWSLGSVVWIFTVAIVCLGLSAAFAGKWLERVGPRVVGTVAAACWGGGFLVGAAGIWTHQLWLVYLGYGVIGGCGLGLGYVSPVSTLIRWFPDRRGRRAPERRFYIRLARELGMTVSELLDRMSSAEMTEWAALFRLEAQEAAESGKVSQLRHTQRSRRR